MGHRIQVGGRDIGGLFDLESPQTPKGTPPLIGVMVKVDSADATCEKVRSLGGKANAAFDIMEQGRMAVCFDPNGAAFDVWQAKQGAGMDADSEAPWRAELVRDDDHRRRARDEVLRGAVRLDVPRRCRWTASPTPPSSSATRTSRG